MERRVDFRDQFALARPRAQLDGALCFERSAVREIGFEQTLFLQMLQRIRRLGQQLGSPAQQLLPKIFDLKRVHEFFSIGGVVTWRQWRTHRSPRNSVKRSGAEYMNRVPPHQAGESDRDP